MSARELFNVGRWAAVVLAFSGLILAEFGGLRSAGFVLVLLSVAAAGGALSAGVIVNQQESKDS